MLVHLCNFTTVEDVQVSWNGRKIRFDFSERFGPLFLRLGDGEPKEIQPMNPQCQSWQAFEKWHKQYLEARQVTSQQKPSVGRETELVGGRDEG
jgi:hypothetical protein